MSLSNQEILDAISEKSVKDIVELIEAMEKEFNVEATMAMPVAAAAGGDAGGAAAEKTEFDVVMTSFGSNKVAVIKVIRAETGLGLKEAKDLVEGAPANVKEGISKDDASALQKKLEEAGASVEVK